MARRPAALFLLAAVCCLLTALAIGSPGVAQDPNDPEALKDEAFQAAQWAMASEAAEALGQVSARVAQGPELGGLADRRAELIARRDAQERELAGLYGVDGADPAARRAELAAAYETTLGELAQVEAEIDARFPAYGELVAPRALTIAEVQALLGPDEGLLLVFVNPEATYVWGVSRDGSAWARAEDLGEVELSRAVGRLRSGLTAPGARRDAGDPTGPAIDPMIYAGQRRFDRAEAHRLYMALVAPVESVFAGKTTLITVADGPLTGLPLGVLSTAPAGAADDEGWLIDRYALAGLPAASSLKALRCWLAPDAVRAAACPALAVPATPPTARAAQLQLAAFGAPSLSGAAEEGPRGAPADADAVRGEGALADPDKLRGLPALPGSRAELEALAALHPGSLIRMGEAATEAAVRDADAGALARARFVVFSTHGLMAGSAFAEPGLVLTPPEVASVEDDGYLTASEAAGLRLSAELVVLSACNTAAPDGRPGARGLSGLARAFFHAGARGVMVSHWAVSDRATTALITGVFERLDDGDLSRAEALRAAALAVRADPRWRHPAYWAAFSLVGAP